MEYIDKALILSEALPYMQRHFGKTIVVKYGGNAMQSEELKRAVISDIVLLSLVGIRVVVVHGGGPEIGDILKKVGKVSRFVDGLRYTDEETMELVQMVLCGKVGKDLARHMESLGGHAVSFSGIDGGLFKARQLPGDYGLVGEITKVDPKPLNVALDNGYIPLVSTVAVSEDGETVYNINADTAAAQLAGAMRAEKLILLTDVRGLLKKPGDESTLIPVVSCAEVPALLDSGIVTGGMIPKISCCVDAVRQGVERAHILDGRIPHSILIEMFSDAGIGTMIL